MIDGRHVPSLGTPPWGRAPPLGSTGPTNQSQHDELHLPDWFANYNCLSFIQISPVFHLLKIKIVNIYMLGILNAHRKICKRTDTNVAFIWKYSRVSISTKNMKCTRESRPSKDKDKKIYIFWWVERNLLEFSKLIG